MGTVTLFGRDYHGVFFDWDGTLVDSLDGVMAAHNHVRAHYGLPLWSRDILFTAMSKSAREIYPEIYGDKADEAHEMLYGYLGKAHLDHIKALPGSAETLEKLTQAGLGLGIVSNKSHAFLTKEVTHLGWTDYFGAIVGAGEAQRDKPHGDPVQLARVRHKGLEDMDRVLYVGDTETDLKCAGACGYDCVLLTHGEDRSALAAQYDPVAVLHDLRDLATLI